MRKKSLQKTHILLKRTGKRQKGIVLAIVALTWLVGSVVLLSVSLVAIAQHNNMFAAGDTPRVTVMHHSTTPTSALTLSPTPAPTSTPKPISSPTPSPSPLPITPFPSTLQQEVATMMAQGRFFYSGNTSLPEIALTFDDGPNPPYTEQILTILRQYGVKATFFCVGRQIAAYPTSVVQEVADGNIIGNHTWAHAYLPGLSATSIAWQIGTDGDEIQRVTGSRPLFFRPPYGAFNANALTYANQNGLTTFIWNVDPQDWSMPGTNKIVARVLATARNGAIILLHDGGGNRSQTVAALPTIIQTLQKRGYRLVTLQQLVNDAHKIATSAIVSDPVPATAMNTLPTSSATYDLPSSRNRRMRILT